MPLECPVCFYELDENGECTNEYCGCNCCFCGGCDCTFEEDDVG